MSFPEGIAFLDWANGLLVADEGNNRVDFYNKDGKFRNHILVECDGILSPQGIWFRYTGGTDRLLQTGLSFYNDPY